MPYNVPMGYGAGAAEGLEELLARKFLEQKQKQMVAQQQAELAQQGQRDQVAAELGRGNLGVSQGQLAQRTREFDVTRSDDMAAAAAKAEKEAADAAALEQFVSGLPEHLRPTVTGKAKFGVAITPESVVRAPETFEQEDARTFGRFKREQDVQQRGRLQLANVEAANRVPREERLVQVEGPDGGPIWVRESQAVGKRAAQAARAVTGAERNVLAYYNRAKDAESTISTPDQSGSALEDRVAKAGLGTQLGLQYAPNMLQSSDQQAYRQAQRAFTEARLRKESGAAIPTAEYENDAKTYFAQPGDSQKTINLKRQKRKTVLDGLQFSSGRAYDEFYGESSDTGKSKNNKLDPDALLKKYGGR